MLPLTTLSVLPPFTDTGGETEVGVGGGDSEAAVRYFSLILSASLEWPEETSAAVRTSQLMSSEPFNHSCSRRACNVMYVCGVLVCQLEVPWTGHMIVHTELIQCS